LEALYLGKLIISTLTGMMHVDAKPGIHYAPIEGVEGVKIRDILSRKNDALKTLRNRYTFKRFKRELLRGLMECISRRSC